MDEPLLKKESKFTIPKETLCSMFTASSVTAKTNLNIYRGFGGASALLRNLKSSLEVCFAIIIASTGLTLRTK